MIKALTVAGSDSGGGAGIQADLKTFQELSVYGMSVITAITAQNTLGVHGVYPIPLEAVEQQLDAVLSDIGADAVKTGMLFSSELIEVIAAGLQKYNIKQVVVDPVMYAKGGAPLLQQEAIDALCKSLLPLAAVVTPNIPEAQAIAGMDKLKTQADMEEACRRILAMGPRAVLLKGGHLEGEQSIDILFDGHTFEAYPAGRIHTKHTHGTGCTLAAAIAAELAKGKALNEAVEEAKQFVTCGIVDGIDLGEGIGPINHFAWRRVAVVNRM